MSDTVPDIRHRDELASLSVALGLFPLVLVGLITAQIRFALHPTDNQYFFSPHILHVAIWCGIAFSGGGFLIAAWVAWRNYRAGIRTWPALLGLVLNPFSLGVLTELLRMNS